MEIIEACDEVAVDPSCAHAVAACLVPPALGDVLTSLGVLLALAWLLLDRRRRHRLGLELLEREVVAQAARRVVVEQRRRVLLKRLREQRSEQRAPGLARAQRRRRPTRFVHGVGSASPVTSSDGSLFDINVLTVSQSDVIAQLDALAAEASAGGFPVRFIEFGNEFFITSHYSKYFSDADR